MRHRAGGGQGGKRRARATTSRLSIDWKNWKCRCTHMASALRSEICGGGKGGARVQSSNAVVTDYSSMPEPCTRTLHTQALPKSAPSFVTRSSTVPVTPLPPSQRHIRSSSVVPYSTCTSGSPTYRGSTSSVAPLCSGGGDGDKINGADIDPLEAGPDVYPFEFRDPLEEGDGEKQSDAEVGDRALEARGDDEHGEQGTGANHEQSAWGRRPTHT